MLVYADVNPDSQDEKMDYDNIEILDDDLLLEEAVERGTYYSSDFEGLNDSAKKMIDDDQNNNSSNYSNNSTEGREPLENTEEIISYDRRMEPINQKDVGVCRNVRRNVCSDQCKPHKLNEIIELLNASDYKVGKANVIDFSRLESFPLQLIKAVEDFEKKLKEDESLLELYCTY
ncbi:uncharacterized protein LOC107267253 isoform X2 [Cephus cinctus]|uniref:Uncharacterized protein LOC107267253 isoform X2 n=1 Tax=Cephus cinctus TaxID=211228 RepID=A0AAJ7BUH0_CEPCN|nr:uncharacterized protein LOC107267253 isoform X2 [Cephus cinctus]